LFDDKLCFSTQYTSATDGRMDGQKEEPHHSIYCAMHMRRANKNYSKTEHS